MTQIIKPRFAPRDLIDIFIGIPIGLFQAIVLFGIPGVIVGLVSNNVFMGLLGYCIFYCFFLLFSVWKAKLDDEGILFYRVLGNPKRLRWSEINSIEEVGRKEVVIKGWLWPIFPPREFTPCLSAKNHFRITWDNGFCYYPPKDVEVFTQLFKTYMKKQP
ncbi:MAG: hypothetical protein C0403_18035 [Desulfobacterium sp.]|nr:hypothetical protein [Desulfobacterium sp.]